jgi:hypothetical protein
MDPSILSNVDGIFAGFDKVGEIKRFFYRCSSVRVPVWRTQTRQNVLDHQRAVPSRYFTRTPVSYYLPLVKRLTTYSGVNIPTFLNRFISLRSKLMLLQLE